MQAGGSQTQRLRSGLTDEELRAVARWVVRGWLEVERGHRATRDLRPLLAPHLYYALQQAEPRPGTAIVVGAATVGGAQFNRIGRARGYAVVVVRDLDGRSRAVMLVLLRGAAGSWQVIDLRRLQQPPVAGGTPSREDAPTAPKGGAA